MKVELICEMCGCKFEHELKRSGHCGRRRLYCNDCLKVRNREQVRRHYERKANPDIDADKPDVIADPVSENPAYRDRISAIACERAIQAREYVDKLLAWHRMRELDAADRSAAPAVLRRMADGTVVDIRGRAVIGCCSL